MRILFTILLTGILFGSSLYAQYGFGKRNSGTTITEAQRAFFNGHKDRLKEFNDSLARGITEFPIKVHIVRKSDGTSGVRVEDVVQAIEEANAYFLKVNIRFVPLEDYSYINDDNFFKMHKDSEDDLCKDYDFKGVINLYVVNKIKTDRNTFCGYTHYPMEKPIDRIFITQKCLSNGASLPRQIGHYFSLYPTHGPDEGMRTEEFVDGTNCETTGDEICDTPADPGLTGNTVNERCGFIGQQQDGKSKFYRPMTENLMSDNPQSECRNQFTKQQYARILYTALNIRNYLAFPKTEFSKKQLKAMADQSGIAGGMIVKIDGNPIKLKLDNNLYMVEKRFPNTSNYNITVTNERKGYIYILEGDSVRGARLLYPLQGDKLFFKDGKSQFSLPSTSEGYPFDDHSGANYICVLFCRKQLPIKEMLKEINEIEDPINPMQRLFRAFGDKIVANKDINYSEKALTIDAISGERYIVPLFLRLEHR